MNYMDFFEIQLEITSSCKLKCIHCSSEPVINSGILEINYSIEDVKHFINQLILKTDEGSVHLTGGEPLLYKDLPKLIENFKKINPKLKLGLFSSGIIFDADNKIIPMNTEYVKTLKTAGLEEINLSVYSHIPSKHDYIVGKTGAFDITLQTAVELIKHDINVNFNVAISKINIDNLLEIVELAKQAKVKGVRFLRLVKHGRAIANWETIGLSDREQEKALVKLLEMTNCKDGYITVGGFPHLMPCRPYKTATGCQAGKCFFYIDLFGNVFPCGCTKNNENHRIVNISQINTASELSCEFSCIKENYC